MFTGIISDKSTVLSQSNAGGILTLSIHRPRSWDLQIGQSIAVQGVCLTVVRFDEESFDVELVSETLAKSTFGKKIPTEVNLERAMSMTDRFEGHIVQGHVDTVGNIVDIREDDGLFELHISYDEVYAPLVVEKGSIAIDGISLTIASIKQNTFSVAIIPHTKENTSIGTCGKGDMVNLEFDIIGKYVMKSKDNH